jgi:hypothetical protein
VWFLNSVASDTCLAVQQYLNDPRNTTLDALLPCTDLATIDTAYKKTRAGMDNLIHQVIVHSHPQKILMSIQSFSFPLDVPKK